MTLNKARILRSENDASVKQEQNTNINIKINHKQTVNQLWFTSNSLPIGNELDELETKNKFLEMTIEMDEENPLKINSYLICKNELLMNMIKLLTNCDKVEIVIDDCDATCCCISNEKSLMKISKILITNDGKTEDFKYKYNDIYTQFIKYGISLKFTI